jgi:hypothetical protein
MPAKINGFRDSPDQPDLQREDYPLWPCPILPSRLAVLAGAGSPVQVAHLAATVDKSRLSIPHVTKELTCKYLTDLKLIGALEK